LRPRSLTPDPQSQRALTSTRPKIQRRRNDLDEAQAFLSKRGIQAETIEAQGDPGAVIVEAAKDADLVIV
jgi:hypothetical protein